MKRLIPVIHIYDEHQALENAIICKELGLGCFLIHHRKSFIHLFKAAEFVKNYIAEPFWIGTNALDLGAKKALKWTPTWVDAIWTDDSGVVEENGRIDSEWAKTVVSKEIELQSKFEYFAGVAFKYQAPVTMFEEAAYEAAKLMDVVTTSGDGTGIAADVAKIERMAKGVARANKEFGMTTRLAIASGITPENVHNYLPYVDDFLVATGISDSEYKLNKDLTRMLRDRIQSYGQ